MLRLDSELQTGGREVHQEVSFCLLPGRLPLQYGQKHVIGRQERRELLESAFGPHPPLHRRAAQAVLAENAYPPAIPPYPARPKNPFDPERALVHDLMTGGLPSMGDRGLMRHGGLKRGDMGRYVLLPGDPGRCFFIAERFDHAERIAQTREYTSLSCSAC